MDQDQIELECPFCQGDTSIAFKDTFANRNIVCRSCGKNYYWWHCQKCESGGISKDKNATCQDCLPKEYKQEITDDQEFTDLFMHACPVCNKKSISFLLVLRKGSKYCSRCKSLLVINNYASGTTKMVLIMFPMAFLKTPLVYLLGNTQAKIVLVTMLVLVLVIGPRYLFRIDAH